MPKQFHINPFTRLIWALDPFDAPQKAIDSARDFLSSLSVTTCPVVTPVYVLARSQDENGMLSSETSAVRMALSRLASQTHYPKLDTPRILIGQMESSLGNARLLAKYAQEIGANAILVQSHGRSGLKRMALGSLTESLMQLEGTSTIAINAKVNPLSSSISPPQNGEREIIVPVNPGVTTLQFFRRCVTLASFLGTRMTLFHSIPHALMEMMRSGLLLFGGSIIPDLPGLSTAADPKIIRRQRRLELWASWAKGQGVLTEVITDAQGSNAADSIVKLACDRDASLIAMETNAGAVTAVLLGSVTRTVVRQAPCPVFVFHPERNGAAPLIGRYDPQVA